MKVTEHRQNIIENCDMIIDHSKLISVCSVHNGTIFAHRLPRGLKDLRKVMELFTSKT